MRSFQNRSPTLVVLICFFLLTTEVFAQWTNAPVQINSNPGQVNLHYNSGGRRIVRIGNTIIALAPESTNLDYTYRSTDGGATWSIIDPRGAFSGCLITGADNHVYHFYHNTADGTIKMVKFLYDGTPGIPTSIIRGLGGVAVGAYKMMSATVDSTGKLYVAYCHGNPDSCYVSSSSDKGTTWSLPSTIVASAGAVSNFYIKIETDQRDNLLATWKEWSAGSVYFAKSTDGGAHWSTTQLATPSSKANLDVLPASATTYYVFAQSEVSPRGLVFTKSTDGGITWSGWASIETALNSGGYADPSAALGNDGTIYVTYRNDSMTGSGNWREHLAASTNGGESWTVVYNYDNATERVGTRSHLRYQTWYNYGGQLDWTWMQCGGGGTNHSIYFNTNANVRINDETAHLDRPRAPSGLTIVE